MKIYLATTSYNSVMAMDMTGAAIELGVAIGAYKQSADR